MASASGTSRSSTAIGDAKKKGAPALEAFAYHYPEGETSYARFRVHRTVFPVDFLADFGFRSIRRSGPVELARLDFGGLQPVLEGRREKVLRDLIIADSHEEAMALWGDSGAFVGAAWAARLRRKTLPSDTLPLHGKL